MIAYSIALCLLTLAASLLAQDKAPAAADKTWRMSGRVVDEHGEGIAGANVARQPLDRFLTQSVFAQPVTRTDAEGRFQVTGQRVRAMQDMEVPLIAAPDRTAVLVQPAAWFDPTTFGDAAIDVGDVVLLPGATLTGRVRANGRAVAGARIVARDALERLGRSEWRWRRNESYASAALTDDEGAFTLTGVCATADLVVTADGYYRVDLPCVRPGEPLVVDLTPGGFVTGVARHHHGRPCKSARLWIHYVANGGTDMRTADADGTFRINLLFPHAYRVTAFAKDTINFIRGGSSDILEGPTKGLELFVDGDPKRLLSLRTIDAATGRAVETVRAVAFWGDPSFTGSSDLIESMFETLAVKTRGPGEVWVAGPLADEPPTGIVIVKAEGYAPLVLKDVLWSDDQPPQLEAKLVREAVIAGVVLDELTGEPVFGVSVRRGEDDERMTWTAVGDDREPGRAVTDAGGRFHLSGLAAGKHRLRAWQGRWKGEVVEVEVEQGEHRSDVKLRLRPGGELSGKLSGVEPGPGWSLRLRAAGEREYGDSREEWFAPRSAIAPDGTFAFADLEAGSYEVILHIPHHHGRCGFLDVPLAPLRIPAGDVRRDLDATNVLPGSIRGKVVLAGTEVARERLLLALFARSGRERFADQPCVLQPLAADGTFALPAPAGELRVELWDIATRIPLLVKSGVKVASGATTELDLAVELVTVRVTLVSANKGDKVEASRLEVVVEHDPDALPYMTDSGAGVALAGRGGDVELVLPLLPAKLRVHGQHDRFTDGWLPPFPIAEQEITPDKGKANRFEIVVPPAPQSAGK